MSGFEQSKQTGWNRDKNDRPFLSELAERVFLWPEIKKTNRGEKNDESYLKGWLHKGVRGK